MILHVACLPFPSPQGTQAAIDAMLRASASVGRDPHLLTYAHGAYETEANYAIHRIPDFPKLRSLRSGPSWGKVVLDARCVLETRRLARALRPSAVVAHHIEAAVAALTARVAPVYYVAHTSLPRELPVYFPRIPTRPVIAIASEVEARVCVQAAGVAAVAPVLTTLLGEGTRYLPVPWNARSTIDAPTRARARAGLALPRDAQVCLYAGNLDRYQGWECLVEAVDLLRRTHPRAILLLATESEPGPARIEAERRGVADRTRFCRLDSERARAFAHAASDLTWVPRRTAGGSPINMLDAFARQLPVVAMERATAGLTVEGACLVTPNDDASALATAARTLLDDGVPATAISARATRYLETEHDAASFTRAMRELLGEPRPRLAAKRAGRPRSEAGAIRAR